jgi:hypothetical protein
MRDVGAKVRSHAVSSCRVGVVYAKE